jgi:hypothetical protein
LTSASIAETASAFGDTANRAFASRSEVTCQVPVAIPSLRMTFRVPAKD